MEELKDVESVLRLKALIVNNISFKRDQHITENIDMQNSRTTFFNKIESFDNNDALVTLGITMKHKEHKTELNVTMSGLFGFDEDVDDDFMENMFKQNAVSILFPYLRSQLSIVTTQPGFVPVVLPAINIISLLKIDD